MVLLLFLLALKLKYYKMDKEKRSDYSNLEGEFLGLGPNFMLGRILYVTTETPGPQGPVFSDSQTLIKLGRSNRVKSLFKIIKHIL